MKKKVTLKTLYATPQRVVQPGQTVELPRKEADALIKSGSAVDASRDPAARPPSEQPTADDQPPADTGDDGGQATVTETGDGPSEDALRTELTALDRGQLVERAKAAGVKANGRSAAIIDRIVDAELPAGDDDWTDDA